jgi:hypothetical protein
MGLHKGQTNNLKGRPRVPEVTILRDALDKYKSPTGKHLIDHCVELAFKDSHMAEVILKKILPDLTEDQGFKETVRTFLIRSSETK